MKASLWAGDATSTWRVLWILIVLALRWGLAGAQTTAVPNPGSYRISGHVVNAETGGNLAGAEVAIVAVPASPRSDTEDPPPFRSFQRGRRAPLPTALQAVTTDEDGSFAFAQLPAGKYRLSASRRGFIESGYEGHGLFSSAIVTGEGLVSDGLTLRLSPGGVVSGMVIDGTGDPVEEASVSLYRRTDDGLGSIHLYRFANTDDLGQYEFAHLPPGTYFVSASARPWYASRPTEQAPNGAAPLAPGQNLDVLFARTYYADTSDYHAATPITLRSGDRTHADLHLLAVPAVHITLPNDPLEREPNPRGIQISSAPVFDDSEGSDFTRGAGLMTQITKVHGQPMVSVSVAPGEYEVEMGGETMHVNAAGDAQLHPASANSSVTVTGKLGAALGASLYNPLIVTLVPLDGHERGESTGSEVKRDGSFTLEEVRPGSYVVQVNGRGRPMAVTQMEASGAQANGRLLTVGSRPATLAALVAPASSVLLGVAEDAGKPAAGVMVVLVPENVEDHLLFRRDQTDSDGSFVIRNVAPGRYTVVAIRDGWDLEWAKPSVIAGYLQAGEKMIVVDGDGKVAKLAQPLAVQGR